MENIIDFISSIPIFVLIVIGIIILFIESVGRGEIEIKHFKRRGTIIKAKFTLKPLYNNKTIKVFANNQLALNIRAEENNSSLVPHRQRYELNEPREGETVEVQIGNNKVFSGELLLD